MANRPSLYQRQIRATRPTMPRATTPTSRAVCTGDDLERGCYDTMGACWCPETIARPTGTPKLGFTITNPVASGRRGPTLAKDTSRFTRKGQKKRHILPPPACARWDQDENGEWYCSEYFRAQQGPGSVPVGDVHVGQSGFCRAYCKKWTYFYGPICLEWGRICGTR